MIFEDDETLRMYVEESLEHLSNIENDLLEIEEAGADIDEEIVNNVFRAAHSIKGGAGFMGLTNIKELSHKVESVLGMIRSREIIPTPDIISILLESFDTLRDMINNIEKSNEIDISEHVVALVGLTTASLPEEQKGSVSAEVTITFSDGRPVLNAPQLDIDLARKEGQIIYLVEYDLISDIQRKNKTPLDVLTTILRSGTIITSKIDINAVGTLDDAQAMARIPFYILFASVIEHEIIASLFDVDEKYVHVISEDYAIPATEKPSTEKPSQDVPAITEIKEPEEVIHEEAPLIVEEPQPEPMTAPEVSPKPVSTETLKETDEFNEEKGRAGGMPSQVSLRVNVDLLDSLMTLAGELVLSRNQLLQGIAAGNTRALEVAGQRIDMVTSELQEAIMRTRMQSIANVFNKFPRVVRDLAKDLGKEVNLIIEGKNVELDKTIIEAISDPLTHLVRNAVDHGIEPPGERHGMGKDAVGTLKLSAFHEAGQVNIEISDDGSGLDGDKLALSAVKKGLITEQQATVMSEREKIALIFLPGFSTAQKITDVSGRGVGMDVVKTNLDKLGGIVDIDSTVGKGTDIRIKLPLTLAIIPSQIISVGNERYAIPQVNLNELLRIPAAQVKDRIEKVGDAEVVRLRGNLLPLLNLSSVLEIESLYVDLDGESTHKNRRVNLADRRSRKSPLFTDQEEEEVTEDETDAQDVEDSRHVQRAEEDRRWISAINIAVVSAGTFKYGLVVDQLRDSEEIVVKPLGRHLKQCQGYAGATIMGDGKVALILDVAGLAQMAKLTSLEGTERVGEAAHETLQAQKAEKDKASLLLFRNAVDEQCAVPLGMVERIERIKVENIELVGGKKVIQYRGGSLPLFSLNEVAQVKELPETNQLEVIVFTLSGREVGLMVTPPVDAVDVNVEVDTVTLKQPGIMGSAIIGNYTTLMVDIFEIVRNLNPDWFDERWSNKTVQEGQETVLFAEDSDFFRNQVRSFLEDDGYHVIEAEDGKEAWELLNEHGDQIDIVLTDLEMPNMDGFELTEMIKKSEQFSHLTVIALTSLAGDEDVARGTVVGIDDYQIKLDREKLMESVRRHLLEKNR